MVGDTDFPDRKLYLYDAFKGVDGRFSLVSLDCDLYNPMKAGLRFFYLRLSEIVDRRLSVIVTK